MNHIPTYHFYDVEHGKPYKVIVPLFEVMNVVAAGFSVEAEQAVGTWSYAEGHIKISKDGAAFSSLTTTPSHLINGVWKFDLAATDTDAEQIFLIIDVGSYTGGLNDVHLTHVYLSTKLLRSDEKSGCVYRG